MWDYLRDRWQSARLRARYRRVLQEQALELLEQRGPEVVSPDPGEWSLIGGSKTVFEATQRVDLRGRARQLVQSNPYARNLLRLLEVYVAGPGMRVTAATARPEAVSQDVLRECDCLWSEFLRTNRGHFSFVETARRAWRDGECFLRLYSRPSWPPTVRYIDPEAIGSPSDIDDTEGIIADAHDVEEIFAYQRLDPRTRELVEEIPAEEMLHLKLGVDSNERRGVTIFASVLHPLRCFDQWLDTELQARKLQSSIVLWRKVQGSPSQITAFADAAGSQTDPGSSRRERYRPGTILTTSHSTDLQFLQPNTNFGDAVPLGRLVLLSIAAGAGVPEFMLSSDAANASYSSTMVAEGPAVKLFESQQQFLASELDRLWMWVMREAAACGRIPAEALEHLNPQWTFPQLVTRDRSKERLSDARLVEVGVLSKAEVARRDNVDPVLMQAEINAQRASD